MTALVQDLIPFQPLVDQCWGILKQNLSVSFPSASRSHPSQWVQVGTGGIAYPWDFWQGVIVPTLSELIGATPTYSEGWKNPMARNLVEGYLRRNLTGSSWVVWIDFTR